MKIYKYKNYEEYVEAQTFANKLYINYAYVKESTIKKIFEDKKTAENILCHGTKNAAEQKYFKKYFPDAYVIGTEISETATYFPMTVQHDFTFPKKEWIGKFDIVYSNAFDHSIDPEKTIQTWRDQLSPTGKLYLEFVEIRNVTGYIDALSATEGEIAELIWKYFKIEKVIEKVTHWGVLFVCVKK
jgi:hypothetical protein